MNTRIHDDNNDVAIVSKGRANLHSKTTASYDEAGKELAVERNEDGNIYAEIHVSFEGVTEDEIKGYAAERIRRKLVDDLRAEKNFDAAQEFIQESEYDEDAGHYILEVNANDVFPTFSSKGNKITSGERELLNKLKAAGFDPESDDVEAMLDALS